jgi:hypothetical protein
MPTANTTSPKTAKAAKATKARAKAASKATSTKSTTARTRGTTKAKATHAKGARTRATHQAESAIRQTQTATRETAGVVGDYAERAVLIPVGAALIARELVVDSVSGTVSTYSSSTKTQAQLRKFERRGATARNRLEREVRKARVRVERELRQRRRVIESTVSDFEERRDTIVKNSTDFANRVPDLANRVPEFADRVPEFVDKVQERILNLV